MMLAVSGTRLDWDSDIVKLLEAHGLVIRHFFFDGEDRGLKYFYFEMPVWHTDGVIGGSPDSVPYKSFLGEVEELLADTEDLTLAFMNDAECRGKPALAKSGREVDLRMVLPEGTSYFIPAEIRVEMELTNKTRTTLSMKGDRTTFFQLSVRDIRQRGDFLTLNGRESDVEKEIGIEPGETITDIFNVSVSDFAGNVIFVGRTAEILAGGGVAFYQTPPLRVSLNK